MVSWPELLSSPRRRRRLRWVAVALGVCAVLAATIPLLRGGTPSSIKDTFQAGKPVVVGQEKTVRLTRSERRAINATLERFVHSGVARGNLAAAYDLVTPSFRGGTTRAQWKRGDSPIYAYLHPAGRVANEWRVTYSYRGDVGVNLMLASKHPRKVGAIIFQLELLRRHGRWLVDSFGPIATFTPIGAGPQHETGPADYAGGAAGTDIRADKAPLNALWIAIPAAVLGLVLLVPLAFFVLTRVRERRVARAYEATMPRTLPPLPPRRE
jgi:hypothetical protein